jgi:catechol 2,3-dioxygenase-like lactoylglutathione lyase family enzyme
MSAHVHHANIQVSDAQASLTFYRKLGLDVLGCLRLDPVVLYYVGRPGESGVFELAANPGLESRQTGSGHLALWVDDLDALLQDLAGSGIQPERPPFRPGDRRDLRVCFVVDPDGVRVELIDGAFAVPQDGLPDGVS